MAARARTQGPLSGSQKSAVLCMALGTDRAAQVLQHLSPREVEKVSREIASMQTVGTDVVDGVLVEYREVVRAVETVARGGLEVAHHLLEQALGHQRAKQILDRIQDHHVDTGLKRLRRAAPEVLAGILRGEHSQTIALILAHLDVRQAANVVAVMEPDLASDVLYRVARMEKISPEMLALVETGLSSKTDLSLTGEMKLSGGPEAVARVLNLTGQSLEKELLENIATRNADIATQIKSLMFVFEDLVLVDGRGVQRLLRDVEGKELALALKGASEELRQHIKANMSERASAALDEEMEVLGPVRVKDVEAVHTKIIEMLRALEESGEIMIRGRKGQDEIIA